MNILKSDKKGKEDSSDNKDFNPPDSLPNTLIDKDKQNSSGSDAGSSEKVDKHRLPEDLNEPPKSFGKVGVEESVSESKQEESVKQESKAVDEKESVSEPVKEIGFSRKNTIPSYFRELEKRFADEVADVEDHFSSDLIGNMKEYHDAIIKGDMYFLDKTDVDDYIYKSLLELKELEAEWSIRFRELEAAKKLVVEKEEEIETKLADFKELIKSKRKFELFKKKAESGKEFKLANGHSVWSIQELLLELRNMSDEVFSHHVNKKTNDFVNWISHVFKDEDLADELRGCVSRDKIISLLENY